MKCILYTNKLSIIRIVAGHNLNYVQTVHKYCNQCNNYYNELQRNQHNHGIIGFIIKLCNNNDIKKVVLQHHSDHLR